MLLKARIPDDGAVKVGFWWRLASWGGGVNMGALLLWPHLTFSACAEGLRVPISLVRSRPYKVGTLFLWHHLSPITSVEALLLNMALQGVKSCTACSRSFIHPTGIYWPYLRSKDGKAILGRCRFFKKCAFWWTVWACKRTSLQKVRETLVSAVTV